MQPSGPDQYMTRVNLLRTSGSPIKGLSVLIENHTSQGGDKQWCESSTTTQWPHQPKVMGMEERSHMSMNCIFMHVYTHNLAKKTQKTKMQLLLLDGTQVTSDVCSLCSAWNVKGSDTSHKHFAQCLLDTDERSELGFCSSWRQIQYATMCHLQEWRVIYLWDRDCTSDHYLSMPSPSLRWMASVSWRDPAEFLYQPWPGKHQTHRSDGLGRNKDYSLGPLPLDSAFSYLFLLCTNAHRGEHISHSKRCRA